LASAAGVGEHDLGGVGDAGAVKLATGRVEDRLEVAEVGRVDGDLGGDNDLPVVGRRLSAAACSRPRIAVTNREPGPVTLILPCGVTRRLIGLGRAAEPASVVYHLAREVLLLVDRTGPAPGEQLLLQATLGLLQPLGP
jgi:hypothetical protein